jgi:pimeloyl-ACP methyl ester carboxylesterase
MQQILEDFYQKYPLQKILVKNKTWEYLTCGKGKQTLVLLPGGAQTAQSLFTYIQAFENSNKVIAITIYNAENIDECCQAIDEILKKEKVESILLYGYSIGGLLAQSYLRRTKNKSKIHKLIISHACIPGAKSYRNNLVIPFQLLAPFIFLLPDSFSRKISQRYAIKVQGYSKHPIFLTKFDKHTEQLHQAFTQEFFQKYLNKTLWRTWYNLHKEFCYKEKYSAKDLKEWQGKILIIQTDNDPWMKDEKRLKKFYPSAKWYTFYNSAHLTYYYQTEAMIKILKNFIQH